MKSQYTILSLLVRPEIQEKISIGILLFDNEKVLFKFSKNKLLISKDLVSEQSFKLLRETVKNIELKIALHNSDKAISNLFDSHYFANVAFNPSYIQYLSRYANNIVSFSDSKIISLEVNEDNLQSLFNKYIDFYFEVVPTRMKTLEVLKSKHADKIEKYYQVEREINHSLVPNLITPVRIDLSGKNEIDVYIQTLDMEQHYNHIANDINSFLQLKIAYENNHVPMKDFLIAKEPRKHLIKQHDIWSQLRAVRTFNVIDISESEKIIDYAEKHDVKPLE